MQSPHSGFVCEGSALSGCSDFCKVFFGTFRRAGNFLPTKHRFIRFTIRARCEHFSACFAGFLYFVSHWQPPYQGMYARNLKQRQKDSGHMLGECMRALSAHLLNAVNDQIPEVGRAVAAAGQTVRRKCMCETVAAER